MTSRKRAWEALVALGLLCIGARSAEAQVIHFAGTAMGCFYTTGGCVPSASTVSVGGLTYSAANTPQFDGYTDDSGFLAIGGSAENFGLFSLNNSPFDYNGVNFVLEVMFSAPPGVSTLNSAWLQGKVNTTSGGVTIHFDTAPTSLVAIDGTEFNLQMNQLSVSRGTADVPRYNYVSGNVQVTSVTPEPATVGLMLSGLTGLVPLYRRRRKVLDSNV